MTINAIAGQLLAHFSPEERAIPDAATYPGRNAAVMLAMNGALQELYGKGSPWVRFDERGELLNAPARVTLSVTAGAREIEVVGGWQAWMSGCTIVIDGSAVDNQLRLDEAVNVLKYPYEGASGSIGAVVYHDSVTLPAEVLEVIRPVRIGRVPIGLMVSGDAPVFATGAVEDDYGMHRRSVVGPGPSRVAELVDRPLGYALETWSADATSGPRVRMRLKPAAASPQQLDYRVMLAPPVVVTDLTSTAELPVPHHFVESLFFPIARQRLSASPFFRADGSALQETARAYQEALVLLESLNPQRESGAKLVTVY